MEDLKKRQEGFNKEIIPLLGKYKLGIIAVPFLSPDGRILAKPELFDDSEEAKKKREEAKKSVESSDLEKPE